MKKYFMRIIFFCFVTVLFGGKLLAQDSAKYKTLPPITITPTTTYVPEKVWKSFQRYCTNAQSSEWYQINKKFLVKYMTEDKKNQAVFGKGGRLIYNISYGYVNSLPEEIRKQVKGTYYDYNITGAIKVNQAQRTIWVLNIEDAKKMILVRVEDGEMEEIQNYNKI